MGVLEDDQRRHHQDALEEGLDRLDELLATCGRIKRVRLGRRHHLGVEGDREQREPRREVGHDARDEGAQQRAGLITRAVRRDACKLSQKIAPRVERRRRRVLLRGRVQLREAERERAELVHEPRLADAGLADQLDDLKLAHARRVDRGLQKLELLRAADDRSCCVDLRLSRADGFAHMMSRDGALLALDEQRLLLGRVDRPRAVEDVRRRQDLAGLGASRQACREVDRVAHHGVRAPACVADVAGEDVTAIHAGAERQADVGPDDVLQRAHHSLFVLPRARRRSAGEVELQRVDVDIGLEPGQPVRLARGGDRRGERVDSLEHGVRAVRRNHVVRLRELHERDRYLAVLGVAARDGEVGAQGSRDELLEARSGQVRWRKGRAGTRLEALHNAGAHALFLEPRRIYFGSGLGAEHDLARGGEIFELEDARRTRTGDEQLAVRRLREEEMALARVDAGGHAQLDVVAGNRLDRPLHIRRRPGGALGMALVVEEEEQRVPSKLEDVAAVPLGHVDQPVEAGGDPLDELLGAGLALGGQALGERREAGDVDGYEGAVERARPRRVELGAPGSDQPRHVGGHERRGPVRDLGHFHHNSMDGKQDFALKMGLGVSRAGDRTSTSRP